MGDLNRPPSLPVPDLGYVRRVTAPGIVVQARGGPPVHLLVVTEWAESLSFHLVWPWLSGDVHAPLRQAYRLEDRNGRSLPLLDSRVTPVNGRMSETTFFDTHGLGAQTLDLRLRCRLALPVEVPFGG